MAADLFESYAVTLVAALILGRAAFGEEGLIFPPWCRRWVQSPRSSGCTSLGRAAKNGLTTINRSFYLSALISAVLCVIAAFAYLPAAFDGLSDVPAEIASHDGDPRLLASAAVVIGIVLAGVILSLTGYFTGTDKRPVQEVARTSLTGPATVILSGIALGLESTVYTALVIGAAVYGAFLLGGGSVIISLFFIAVAGTGLLTTVGVIVAMDTFGPVSDNAQGIAEMSGDVHGDGTQILTELDAVGNTTTKAITKGIAIATAVLAATALFGSYTDAVRITLIDVGQEAAALPRAFTYEIISANTLVGVLLGASVVFLFSGPPSTR